MKKRYPARMVCAVWAILALRLLIPVQLTLPQAPVQVMPRTSYVVQSDQTAFRQAGLPVTQTPARWVPGMQAQKLSAADTGTVKTVDITDMLLTQMCIRDRHSSAAQLVSLEFTDGTCELGVWYNLSSQKLSVTTR